MIEQKIKDIVKPIIEEYTAIWVLILKLEMALEK